MKRLTFSLLLVIILTVIGLGWAIDQWYQANTTTTEDPALLAYKKMGRELAYVVDQTDNITINLESSTFNTQLSIYENFPLPTDLQSPFIQGEPLLLNSDNQLTLHFYLPRHNAVLSLSLPEETPEEPTNLLSWLLTFLFYFGVILVVLVWLYPLLKSLLKLQKATQEFGAGNLRARVATNHQSYIHTIEQEFNRMAQRIEQLITDNKLLSRSLSHDLRTPLARLRFGIDVLHEGELTPLQQQHLTHLNQDLAAMESLVEAMLNYSKLDSAELKLKLEKLDLAAFTLEFIENLQNTKIRFVNPTTEIFIHADRFYLNSVLQNLIGNAIKYANHSIYISLDQSENAVLLTIEDDGIGINQDEKEKVLQPFYRSTQNEKSGYGLGLAIVNRIVLWHKGTIHIEPSTHLGGAKIIVEFKPHK